MDFKYDFIVETTTEEEYQMLMDLLDKDGYLWIDKTPIHNFNEKGFKKGYRFILVNPKSKIIGQLLYIKNKMRIYFLIYRTKMERLKKYNDFINEGILDIFGKADDKQALHIFEDMKKDFEMCDKDLRKTKMFDNLNSLVYVFREWSLTTNSGNYAVGDKRIKVYTGGMEVNVWNVNPKHDPNHPMKFFGDDGPTTQEDRDKWRIYNEVKYRLDISRKLSKKILNYFINEWDNKYPQLKGSQWRNGSQIQEIENGEKPVLTYVDEFAKNGVECIFSITNFKDIEKYQKWIRNSFGIECKSKEGYPITFCYPIPPKIEVDKNNDPYNEEQWYDDPEQLVVQRLRNMSEKEIKDEIKKEIEKL